MTTANDFNSAHSEVVKLVETFGENHSKYMAADYNESAVRKDFIDKFFIALGWDVNHDHQTNPYEQEVKVERNVSVAARVKKADYAFFLKPNFFRSVSSSRQSGHRQRSTQPITVFRRSAMPSAVQKRLLAY